MLARCTSANGAAVSPRNRLLHQTLLQPDPQIASHNLHDILGLNRRSPRKKSPHQRRLRRRSSRRSDLPKCSLHLKHAQPLSRAGSKHLSRDRPQVAMLPVSRCKFVRAFSSQLRHNLPKRPSAHLQRRLFPAGNARPERNTADTAASSTVRDVKYSATIPVFSSFFVVAAISSQAVANRSMSPHVNCRVPHFSRAFCARKPALSEVEGWGFRSGEASSADATCGLTWVTAVTYHSHNPILNASRPVLP